MGYKAAPINVDVFDSIYHGVMLIVTREKNPGSSPLIVTFRLEYEDDYEYEVTVLSMRFRLAGENFRSARDHYFKLILQAEGRYCLAKHVPKALFFFVVCTNTN